MRFAYLTVIILALNITVTARVFNAKGASHLKARERFISGDDDVDVQNDLIVRDFLENYVAKRKYSAVSVQAFLQIEIEINIYDK